MSEKTKWPKDATVAVGSKWLLKDATAAHLKEGTNAVLTGVDTIDNEIKLFINPAIGWRGTYQELVEEWEPQPSDTPLTF